MEFRDYEIEQMKKNIYSQLLLKKQQIQSSRRQTIKQSYKDDAIKLLEQLIAFKESYGVDTQGDKNEIINFTNM